MSFVLASTNIVENKKLLSKHNSSLKHRKYSKDQVISSIIKQLMSSVIFESRREKCLIKLKLCAYLATKQMIFQVKQYFVEKRKNIMHRKKDHELKMVQNLQQAAL